METKEPRDQSLNPDSWGCRFLYPGFIIISAQLKQIISDSLFSYPFSLSLSLFFKPRKMQWRKVELHIIIIIKNLFFRLIFFFFFLPLPFSISLLIRISNRSEQWQKSEMQVHLRHLLGPVWGLGDEKVKTSDQKILGSSVIFASPQNASDSYR